MQYWPINRYRPSRNIPAKKILILYTDVNKIASRKMYRVEQGQVAEKCTTSPIPNFLNNSPQKNPRTGKEL